MLKRKGIWSMKRVVTSSLVDGYIDEYFLLFFFIIKSTYIIMIVLLVIIIYISMGKYYFVQSKYCLIFSSLIYI